MHTSKAFRCTLPSGLRDDQLSNIRHWAYLHCAQSGLLRDDRGVVAHRQGDEVADARQRPAGARGAVLIIFLEAPVEPAAALEAALVGLERVVERQEALDRPPARPPLAPARDPPRTRQPDRDPTGTRQGPDNVPTKVARPAQR